MFDNSIRWLPQGGAREMLETRFRGLDRPTPGGPLWLWGKQHQATLPHVQSGEDKLRAAIAALRSALDALGNRNDSRAVATRAWLTREIERLEAPLSTFESIGGYELDGPAALDLIERVDLARVALASARREVELATRDSIKSAKEALELAEVDGRELDREIDALEAKVRYPQFLPNIIALVEHARAQTAELARLAKSGPRCMALELALRQGREAPRELALLWVAFERSELDVFEIRHERAAHQHGQEAA